MQGIWQCVLVAAFSVGASAAEGPRTLLVAGGSGKTGSEVVRAAQAQGYTVRATTRDAARARAEMPDVEWFEVDVRVPETLASPMRGVDVVVSAIGASIWEGPESPQYIDYQGNVNLIDAAKAAGVEYFVLVSSASAGSHRDQSQSTRLGGILKWKTMAEEHLRASGLPYTIIGPAGLTNDAAKQKGLRAVRRENYQSSYVARADVARVAVDSATNPAATRRSFALYNDGGAMTETWRDDLAAMAPDAAQVVTRSPLDRLAWLAGHWYSETDGTTLEELWLPPKGGTMLAVAREVGPDGRGVFEFMRLVVRGEDVFYAAQPGGRYPPTEFRLVSVNGESAVFTKPDHDFPRMLAYSREGIVLRARLEGVEDGKPVVREYRWRLIGSK